MNKLRKRTYGLSNKIAGNTVPNIKGVETIELSRVWVNLRVNLEVHGSIFIWMKI